MEGRQTFRVVKFQHIDINHPVGTHNSISIFLSARHPLHQRKHFDQGLPREFSLLINKIIHKQLNSYAA